MLAAAGVALLPSVALGAEEAAESHGSWLTFAFFAINFILFAILLVYFAVPFARKYFADRAGSIRTSLSRAQSALAEAQDLANAAVKRMAALDRELQELAEELESETAFQIGRIKEIATAAAQRIRKDMAMSAAALADAGQRRVRERLAAAAATLARDLIRRDFESRDQERLVESFMHRLGQEGRR
jgi:F-type H+-transporting ATPase subunit b